MLGVARVEKRKIEFEVPTVVLNALDRYRSSMIPRPSRNFLIVEALVKYLRDRGETLDPDDPDLT